MEGWERGEVIRNPILRKFNSNLNFCVFLLQIIHMRTNIEIDDTLMEKALKAGNSKTKKQVVEKALELYVRMKNQEKLLDLWGKIEIDEEAYK